uniref:Serine/threonine-protein kinase 1 n=1 Tax=Parascaris univalens TaxID=6257 RepID=A0A914ZYD1_PARUN
GMQGHDQTSYKDKYELSDKLGCGGFGTVYSGMRIKDKLPVAVKYIRRRKVTTWQRDPWGGGIPLEIVILQQCQNIPGVVKMLDWYERTSGFLIVMERPEWCQDLFDYVTFHGPLAESLAKNFFKQVVDTVIGCGWKDIVHRDIKDENVIIDLQSGHVKLVGFGCAAFINRKGASFSDFQGTLMYSPPEWLLFSRYDGLKAAVWSLGILLYDMVCGEAPFHTRKEIVRKSPISWPVRVSACCRDLVEECLQRDPSCRLTLNGILDHPWMRDGDFSLPISVSVLRHGGHDVPDIKTLRQTHMEVSVDKPALVDPFGRAFLPGSHEWHNAITTPAKNSALFGNKVPDIKTLRQTHMEVSVDKPALVDPFGRAFLPGSHEWHNAITTPAKNSALFGNKVAPPSMKPCNGSGHHHRCGFRHYANAHSSTPYGRPKALSHFHKRLCGV